MYLPLLKPPDLIIPIVYTILPKKKMQDRVSQFVSQSNSLNLKHDTEKETLIILTTSRLSKTKKNILFGDIQYYFSLRQLQRKHVHFWRE